MMDSFLAIPQWLKHSESSTSEDKKWKKPSILPSVKMMRQFHKQALKAVHLESAATFESTDLQEDDRDEQIDDHPVLQDISPLADPVSGPPVPQDRWSI
uniref:Uncharacterized protein n=1 Tax=Tanacetum cinerariifolium TaxID=118510 RepID=A0A699QS47_TANCI|nr:hypothetical protein [Tanacetum cinerariifolium]